jgi:hypothetical protein
MADEMQNLARKLIGPLWPWIADRVMSSGGFTPTYLGGTTAGVTTYTTQWGAWVRIGPIVIATATIQWSAATGTGDAQFSLPFTAINTANQFYSVAARTTLVTFANSAPVGQIVNNTSFMVLTSPVTNAAAATVAMEAAGFIIYTATYFVG